MIEFTRYDQRMPDEGVLPPAKTWDYAPTYEGRWAHVYADDLAFATCPFGHTCRLSKKVHSVAADGTLSPSYVCPATGCTFHDFVRLVGWTRK